MEEQQSTRGYKFSVVNVSVESDGVSSHCPKGTSAYLMCRHDGASNIHFCWEYHDKLALESLLLDRNGVVFLVL